MKNPFKRRKLPRHPTVWWSRIKLRWPFLIWLLAILAGWWLYRHGIETAPLIGVVKKKEQLIAPVEIGRLIAVYVRPGDSVTNGQVVAQQDTSIIDAEIRVEKAVTSEESGTITGYQQNIIQLEKNLSAAIRDAELALTTEQRSYAEATAELNVLKADLDKFQPLVDSGHMARSSITTIKARKAALEKSVEYYAQSINALQVRVEEARKEVGIFHHWLGTDNVTEAIIEKLGARRKLHAENLDLLLLRRKNYTLLAKRNGAVSRVFFEQGDVAAAGIPVLSIIEEASTRVIGFLPESRARDVTNAMPASVQRQSEPAKGFPATVEATGPEILGLPGRVTPIPGQPIRGRRIVLRLCGEHDLIPGETVRVHLIGKREGIVGWLRKIGDRLTGKLSRPVRGDL